jgi:hypothetical protein
MSEKASYRTIVTMNLYSHGFHPGDVLTVTLRNEHDGAYQLAERLKSMFLKTFYFYPESIALHPDHLAILKKQGKSLDIILSEEMVPLVREFIELTDIPHTVPLIADESLDLFSAIAQFEFREEETKERAIEAIMYSLKTRGGK